ncbi:MFS transporter [Arsenicicoccus dermatophilus]|uniref:MFS transporter n=1 Tax=Arsenicicoccus dermatophilus TaxID=1076331 RepID=UPI0039170D0E
MPSTPAAVPTLPTAPDADHIPREIWVLVAAALFIALGFGLIAPVLPAYARSFDVSVTAASVVVSSFALMRLLWAPVGGRLIGSWGERPVYLAGLLIVALSTGACAFAQSYWQLLVFRALGGIGSTMFTVSAAGLIVRLAPPSMRGRASSAYASAFLVGNILGPVVGGLLAGLGYRTPFMIYAVALLIASLVVAVFLKDAALRPAPGSTPLPPMTLGEAAGHPTYRAILAAGFANGWANFGVRVALLPLLAVTVLGVSPGIAGMALAAFAVGNALALTVAGRLTDLRGRRPLVIAGLAVNGAFTLVLGLTPALWLLFAASVIAGMGAGMFNPAQQAAVADVVGTERSAGQAVAAFQMVQDAGTIVGPVLAGVIVDHAGYPWAFGLSGLITLLAILPWLRAPETAPPVRTAG